MLIDADRLFVLALLFAAVGGFFGYGYGRYRGYLLGVQDAIDEIRPSPPKESP